MTTNSKALIVSVLTTFCNKPCPLSPKDTQTPIQNLQARMHLAERQTQTGNKHIGRKSLKLPDVTVKRTNI
jgi:hypothetical protein